MSLTSIIVADDDTAVRKGLRHILSEEKGFKILAEAKNGGEVISQVFKYLPDVIIIDIKMPELNGLEASVRILSKTKHIKILGFSGFTELNYIAGMMKIGASGFLCKNCSVDEIVAAVRVVASGGTYMDNTSSLIYRNSRAVDDGSYSCFSHSLTTTEREILQLRTEGYETKEISLKMGVSEVTTRTHIRNINQKLGFRNLADMTRYAIREGITSKDLIHM